ncbi:MAG TPA: helix-turn-helix transcriptional regulator [Myxococcota bacterium]|jgi:DNA-binding CsgD family transcriptional regulator
MLELPRPSSDWAFVGRKHELELALAELDAGRSGLVIAGPPGVGRTRLAAEIARAAAARGHASAWLTGDAAEPERIAAFEAPWSGLLVVDDAHLVSSSAARRLECLVKDGAVFLVATLASGQRGPAAIRALWKEAIAPRIDLSPLGEPALAELLESALAARVERGTCRLLWRVCQGNLVWLRELLREGLARGVLERHAGVWRYSGPLVLGPPLTELALESVQSLSESARRTFESIAIAETLELALLGAALADGSLEQLERRGLITIERDGLRSSARVAQPLCGEAVRQAMPRSRALQLHRELGAALLRIGMRRASDRFRAATFLLEGDPAAGAPFFASAAEEAWARAEPVLAERFARAGLNGAHRALARHILSEALSDQNRFDEAFAEWDALDGLEIDDALRARAARSRAAILAFARGRTQEARDVLERAEARVGSADLRMHLAAVRTAIDATDLPPEQIVAATEQVLRESDLEPFIEHRTLFTQFLAAIALGRFDRVLGQRPRALRATQRIRATNPFADLYVHINSFYAHLFRADLEAAEALAAEQREAHLDDPYVAARGYWTYGVGVVQLWRGGVTAATALLREAGAVLLAYDNGARQAVLFELAIARALAGAGAEAEEILREAEASRRAPPHAVSAHARARGFVRAASGERSAAREILVEAGHGFLASGRPLPAILALHDAIRFGAGVETARALRKAASHTDGPLLAALAHHGFALATRDAPALDRAAERLSDLGVLFYAADAARAACEHHAKAGRAAASVASLRTFEYLAAQCEGAVFPPLGVSDPLSRREREVAELAARGASDREIAARLSLSVRTVNAHLRAVYGKLELDGRGALRALMASPGDGTHEENRAK